MNLLEFADRAQLGPSFQLDVVGRNRLWEDAYRVIGNESRTDPTIAAVLSQILLRTPQFTRRFARPRQLQLPYADSREVMLIPRSTWGDYVLLLADDSFPETLGQQIFYLDPEDLLPGLFQLRQDSAIAGRELAIAVAGSHVPNIQARRLLDVYANMSAKDLGFLPSFLVYFVRRPRRLLTSAPIPGWKIQTATAKSWTTAGCRVRHADGRIGVTSAHHFFVPASGERIAVTVGSLHGVVVEQDLMSDSVFIEVAAGVPLSTMRGAKGWLQGIAPRLNDEAEFDGATTGRTVKTAVSALDPGVTTYSQFRQARVYTPPVTNPGDSGAALVETSSDQIVGFAHERTESGALVEWSSWIWADSVFQALNVQPY